MILEGMTQGTATAFALICIAMAIILLLAAIYLGAPWGFFLSLAAFGLVLSGGLAIFQLPIEDYTQGHTDALNNPNFDKYQLCVNYSEKCSDFEYQKVADTKKLNYCKGYIDGYEEKNKRLELENIENDINKR